MTKAGNKPIAGDRQAGATESSDAGEAEMVLVPRKPTEGMIKAAYYAALAEDAEEVWEEMIDEWLQDSNKGKSGSESC